MGPTEHFRLVTTTYEGKQVQQPVSPYKYSPLSERNNEFRLVRLKPSNDLTSPICSSLEHHSLLNAPTYLAVSYEVGNPSLYAFISLDGIQVPVSVNLYTALYHLRHHGYLLLWVDSLCINQNADEEKSSQILRIQVIYQEAAQVAVWLGAEAHGSWKVMRHMRATGGSRRRLERKSSIAIENYDRSIVAELSAFFMRSYFSRVWVIQEVVVGSRVSLFCGWEQAEWEDLQGLVNRVTSNGVLQGSSAAPVECFLQIRNNKMDGCSMSMLEILHRTSFARSTNPMDKVYAMLRLAFDHSAYVSEPKYGWGSEDLCMRMSRTFMSSKRSLDIMFVGRKSRRSVLALPSWCPDYTCFPSWSHLSHLVKYVSGQDERARLGTVGRKWRATEAADSTSNIYVVQGHLLQVKGARVATIHSLANLIGEEEIRPSRAETRARQRDWIDRLRNIRISPSRKERDAVGRTIFSLYSKDYVRHLNFPGLFNHLLYRFNADDYREEKLDMTPELKSIAAWRKINRYFNIGEWPLKELCEGERPKPVEPFESNITENSNSTGGMVSVLVDAGRHVYKEYKNPQSPSIDIYATLTAFAELINEGLRLMTTREGYLGWAHPLAQPGDHIYLLAGCSMPVILHQHKTQAGAFTVIGHAYVDGMIDGGFWESCVERGIYDVNIL